MRAVLLPALLLSSSVLAQSVNVALNKPVTFSSDNAPFVGALVNDGDQKTRWSSQYSDPQFISIDLQAAFDVSSVCLFWEFAYAKNFTIDASTDGQNWTAIFVTTNNASTTTCVATPVQARYLRMNSAGRATGYGNSIYEFQVFGIPHTGTPPANAFILESAYCYADDNDETRDYGFLPPRLMVAWYCDRPGGIQGYVRVYTFGDAIVALKAKIAPAPPKEQKRILDSIMTTRELTPDEIAASKNFLSNIRPTASVSFASQPRPVFAAKADRSLGLQLKGAGATVPIGYPCLITDRLVMWNAAHSVGTGTSYYKLKDREGYAVCTVTGKVSK